MLPEAPGASRRFPDGSRSLPDAPGNLGGIRELPGRLREHPPPETCGMSGGRRCDGCGTLGTYMGLVTSTPLSVQHFVLVYELL